MPTLHAYLGFPGTCAEAMRFYAKTFNAELKALIRNGDSPMADQLPPESRDRIMHAFLVHPDFQLMAGDSPQGAPAGMQGCMLTLTYDKADEAERIFKTLSEGGQVTMPMDETFWAQRFGMCVDRYGTAWGINGGPKAMG